MSQLSKQIEVGLSSLSDDLKSWDVYRQLTDNEVKHTTLTFNILRARNKGSPPCKLAMRFETIAGLRAFETLISSSASGMAMHVSTVHCSNSMVGTQRGPISLSKVPKRHQGTTLDLASEADSCEFYSPHSRKLYFSRPYVSQTVTARTAMRS